jgi:branched-chain amino acid transport system permease protein
MIRIWDLGIRVLGAIILVIVALVPTVSSTFFTSQVGLTSLSLGLVAVSLVFLSMFGGMVSLAQTALFGVAGMVAAKLAVDVGLNEWVCLIVGVVAATLVGLVFGAVASGSVGIYFLVITLAFAEIAYYYFSAVPTFGMHEGINRANPPAQLGDPVHAPTKMYYFSLAVCLAAFIGLKYLSRTAFGLALQGIRDDPQKMAALGFSVRLHRTLGFAIAAPVAGLAGVLATWSNTRTSADSISFGIAVLVLTAAVIGGLNSLGGAWVGAFVYTLCDTYMRGWTDRFATYLGLVFLAIVLWSPGGIVGGLSSLNEWFRRWLAPTSARGGDPNPRFEDVPRRPSASPVEGPIA